MRRFDTVKPVSPAFGLAPQPRRTLVANLAAGAGGRTRKRRDRGRVIVRLDLHDEIDVLANVRVYARVWIRKEARSLPALDDRRVVPIGRQHAARVVAMGVADHREQRLRLRLAVDDPVGVEDLVPAMLGVGLREHHQLDVGGVAPELEKVVVQVLDFIFGERETQPVIGLAERGAAARSSRHAHEGLRLVMLEQHGRRFDLPEGGFGHAIVQRLGKRLRAMRARAVPSACTRYAMPRSSRRTPPSPQHARCRWPCSTTARRCRDAARPGSARRSLRPRDHFGP